MYSLHEREDRRQWSRLNENKNIHALGTPRYPSALFHAVELAPAIGLGLALHIVIVVVAAAGADEERGREKGRRAGTNLLDLGDRVREGGGVVMELLVEPGREKLAGRRAVAMNQLRWSCRQLSPKTRKDFV